MHTWCLSFISLTIVFFLSWKFIAVYLVLSFFWVLLTFWSASGKSDSFLRSFFVGAFVVVAADFVFFVVALTATCSFDSRFDFKKDVIKRKMRKPWMVKAIRRPNMPRIGFNFAMPVKKVRNERTKVENAVKRKTMLLQTRTKSREKIN